MPKAPTNTIRRGGKKMKKSKKIKKSKTKKIKRTKTKRIKRKM
jgi:hypothetical protein